jgi:hypothetical protein
MSKKVIYSYIQNDESRLIVDKLYDEYGWEPVFFHGQEEMREWTGEHYANAVLHDAAAMRKSKFDYSRIGFPVPIDCEIIEALSKYELNYLNWLQIQDITGFNFSFSQRRRYYYDVLKYWNTVINNLKPDLFVAYTWPHLPSDYPLYLLCKHYYNIPVLFLDPIPYLDNIIYSVGTSLENLSAPFEAIYLSEEELKISDVVRRYLERQRSLQPQTPKHITTYYRVFDKSYKRRYLNLLGLCAKVIKGTAFKDSGAILKNDYKPWDLEFSPLSNFKYYFFKNNLIRRNIALRKTYNQHVISPDLEKKYIYFPAPYQPEVLSNHCAGVYEDVFLVLDMISHIIPDDWVIYYKEHPNTFTEDDLAGLMKDKYYYERLSSYKKVKMVPSNTSTFQLIDNSQAVCTVGGTAGWEAVLRGKPALVYGSLWYQSCKSVFTIKTSKDAIAAIKKIMDGFVPDAKDVERYAESIYRASYHRLVQRQDLNHKDLSPLGDPRNTCDLRYEMGRVAEAFFRTYDSQYGGKNKN